MNVKKWNRIFSAGMIVAVVIAAVLIVTEVIRARSDQRALDNVGEITSLSQIPTMSDSGREEKLISLTSQAYWTCGEDRLSPASITDILVAPVKQVGIETIREYQIQVLGSEQVVAVLTVVERPIMNSSGGQTIVETWSCTGPK